MLLRLDDFHVVGHAGGEAVLRLRQRLLGEIEAGLGNLDLLRSGFQVEDGILHFLFDTRPSSCRPAPGAPSARRRLP